MTKCLICLSSVSTTHGYPRHTKSGPSFPSSCSEGPSLNCPLLDEEVDHFYLTHKLLGVSDEVCGSLLQTHGNPSSWFSLCGDCGSRFLDEGKKLFDQIQHLTKLHDDVRKGALERMRVKMEIEVEEVDEAGVFPDEEEESMMIGTGGMINVVVIDPSHTEEDDCAMATIRSYFLTSSVDDESTCGYEDDEDVNIETQGDISVMNFNENDETDEDYVPSPGSRVKKGRGRPQGIIKAVNPTFDDEKGSEEYDLNTSAKQRKSKRLVSRSRPASLSEAVPITTGNDHRHEDSKTVQSSRSRPPGVNRRKWRKLQAAKKNAINQRPKGMQSKTWQRLIRLSKQSPSSTQTKTNEDEIEKLSDKKKRKKKELIRDRTLALAAKFQMKSQVDALMAEEENEDEESEDEGGISKKKRKGAGVKKCKQCTTDGDLLPGETMEDHTRRLHTSPEVLACRGCGQVMVKIKDYLEHLLKAKEENASSSSSPCVTSALPCSHPTCAKKTHGVMRGSQEALAIHYTTSHYAWKREREGDTHRCDICGKVFPNNNRRNIHVKRVHLSPLVKCDRPNCTAVIRGLENLRKHIRNVHMVEEKVLPASKCPECGREFKNPRHLKRHQQLHGAETPYLCQECGKGYKVWEQLRIHMWSHDEELYKEKYGKYKQNAIKRKAEGGRVVRRKSKKPSRNEDTNEAGPSSSSSSSVPPLEVVVTASASTSEVVSG